jgi:hypothetical protein
MEALIDEVKHGEGSSRVTAIRELTALAGLVKDTEKQDEPSPYETEERHVLEDRLTELLGSLPMFNSLLKSMAEKRGTGSENNPTTSEGTRAHRLITPLPSGTDAQVDVPAVSGDEVDDGAGDGEPVAVVAVPLKVMLT